MEDPLSRRKKRKILEQLAESSETSADSANTLPSTSSMSDLIVQYDFTSLQGSAGDILASSGSERSSGPSGEPALQNTPDSSQMDVGVEEVRESGETFPAVSGLSAVHSNSSQGVHHYCIIASSGSERPSGPSGEPALQNTPDSSQMDVGVEEVRESGATFPAVSGLSAVHSNSSQDSSYLNITAEPLQISVEPNLIEKLCHDEQTKFIAENQSYLPDTVCSPFEILSQQLINPMNPDMGHALNFSAFLSEYPREEAESASTLPPDFPSWEDTSSTWNDPPTDPDTPAQHSLDNSSVPLYQGSQLSVHDCMVSILTYAQSAHLSGKSTSKLIELLEMFLPKPNNLPKTAHMFNKYFKDDSHEIQLFFYCSNCYKSRESSSDICNECPGSKRVNYFIASPLDKQLRRLYSRPGFSEKLKYKFNRVKKNVENIEDLFDGSVYKEAEKGVLGSDKNISLTWYTDGISIYECSTYSLWPSMYTINELPPEDRHKAENILIGGLWGGDGKPHPNIFLLPQYHELKKINEGISVKVCDSGEEISMKAVLLIGTCDVPAKASFMNMKGHSGYFSCPKCFIEGEKSERTGGVLVFPHQDNLEFRNDENYLQCAQLGVHSKDGYKGVFGPTILSFMFYGSFISGMTCDIMHLAYMGCLKQLLKLWFDPKYKGNAFSLCEKIPQVNERLKSFHLPHFVQRLLLEVDKSLSFWKASLCRNFLLYVVLILLRDILPDRFLTNLCMFVEGISLLNSDSISLADLERSDQLLCQFCKDFEKLYGVRHMSSNFHLVRHLKQSVVDCGNLFVNSCFRFEDLNGQLAALVHGTRHAIKQITSRLELVTELPLLIKSVHSEELRYYCNKLRRRSKTFKIGTKIGNGEYVVGEYSDVSPYSKAVAELLAVLYPNERFRFFDRLFKNNHLFVSLCYEKGSRVSCYCKYEWNGGVHHGLILTFVQTANQKYFVLLEKSTDVPSDLYRYVKLCPSGDNDLVPVSVLMCVSFCFDLDGNKYLIDPLNDFELE